MSSTNPSKLNYDTPASVYKTLVDSGLSPAKALRLSGLGTVMPTNSGAFGDDLSYLFGGNGMNGYADGMVTANPGAAMNTPLFQGALGNMMNAYASMYGADAGARGTIGAAEQQRLAQQYMADAQKALGLDTNKTNYNINDINSLRQLLGVQDTNKTQLGISGNQLAGVKDTNLANQNIATTQGNAQMGTATINQGPNNQKLDILRELFGLGGTGGSGVGNAAGGIGNGILDNQTAGGTVINAGSGTNNTYQANSNAFTPQFRSFDDIMLQKKMGAANADIAQQYDTQNKQMTNSLAGRGFSTNSPGFQALIANNNALKLGAMQDSNRELQNTAMQYNAQNALPYANLSSQNYNQQQDRDLRLKLAQMANSNGLLTGLLSV